MPLHCKACDAPLDSDNDFVCSLCLSHAMRLVPTDLIELPDSPNKPLSKKEVDRLERWINSSLTLT